MILFLETRLTHLRCLTHTAVKKSGGWRSGSRAWGQPGNFFPHAAAYNTFNAQHDLVSAPTYRVLLAKALATWRTAVAAAGQLLRPTTPSRHGNVTTPNGHGKLRAD